MTGPHISSLHNRELAVNSELCYWIIDNYVAYPRSHDSDVYETNMCSFIYLFLLPNCTSTHKWHKRNYFYHHTTLTRFEFDQSSSLEQHYGSQCYQILAILTKYRTTDQALVPQNWQVLQFNIIVTFVAVTCNFCGTGARFLAPDSFVNCYDA